ncbi:MAG TPA: DUF58 domain-containing protein [Polyangiaceae bacterium]|nr:DUF58 domain-containing protein [Polyangiaceae bacterium]
MSFLGRIRSAPKAPEVKRAELFDDEFQRKLEMLSLLSRRIFSGQSRAERRSKKQGSGVEFADYRDYVPGDDFRYVDWQVYQRFARLLVRLYEEEEDLGIYFLLDTSSSMGFGGGHKFDQARRLCAALAYVGLKNLDRITIVTLSDRLEERMPTTRGKGRIFKVFQFLSGLETGGQTNLGDALRTFTLQHKRRGLAVLISDLYDLEGFEHGINVLRYNKFEPYVLNVFDRKDALAGLKGDLSLYDCETGEARDVTVTDALLSRMERVLQEYRKEIETFCTARKVPYFAADVDAKIEDLVLDMFRRGGFLH